MTETNVLLPTSTNTFFLFIALTSMATISSDGLTFVAIGRWSWKIPSQCLERAMLTGSRLSRSNNVFVGDRHLTIARSLSSKRIKYCSCPNCNWLRRDSFKKETVKEFLAVTRVYSRLWNTWPPCWILKNLHTLDPWAMGDFPLLQRKLLTACLSWYGSTSWRGAPRKVVPCGGTFSDLESHET